MGETLLNAPVSATAWLPISGLTRLLELDPPFPVSVVESLACRGLTLRDLSLGAGVELSCRGSVDYGDDDFAFLVARVAGHAAEQSEALGCDCRDTPCLSNINLACLAGVTLVDVAHALARPRANIGQTLAGNPE